MAYTTADLLAELLIAIGNRSDTIFNEAWRTRKLVFAYREIWGGFIHPELEASDTDTVAVNQRVITLPADCFAVLSVRDATNSKRLTQTSHVKMDNKLWVAGSPDKYMRYGTNLEVDPYSATAWSMIIRYQKRAADLSSTQNSELASEWDEAILFGAQARAFKDLGQTTRAIECKNEYLALVRSRLTQTEYEAEESDFGMELKIS